MRRTAGLVIAAAVVVFAAGVFAQAKPNFAGKWTLVPDPNAPAAGGGRGGFGGMGQAFTAAQDDKTLTMARTLMNIDIKSVYNLDGSDNKNTITIGATSFDQVSKAKWDGAKLVITTKSEIQGNAIESTQTWSLDAAGNLIIEETSNFQGNTNSVKVTFKKG